ncbi:hypothetical protein [Lachnoclostridium phocaeense]|uniref:hypothetical protein n=1 Tax=Lachnoclostridium phocaeense TaxID=1871021 RepID=UPI00248F1713|nr:hypothetical protein [Lachnoclostridium phocaeense]
MKNEKENTVSKSQKDRENQSLIDSYDYMAGAASASDCTGLIPAAPVSEAERESYLDLYAYQYLPPKFPSKEK